MKLKHVVICVAILAGVVGTVAVCSKCAMHGVPTNDNHNKVGCKRFPKGHECELCMPSPTAASKSSKKRKRTGASPPQKNTNARKGEPLGDKGYGIRSFHITVTKSGRDTPKGFFDIGADLLRQYTIPGLHASCCEEIGKEERHRHVHFALPLRAAPGRRGVEQVRREVKRRFPNEDKHNHVNVKEMKGQHRIEFLVGYHMKTYGDTPLRKFNFNFTQSEIVEAYNR